MQQTMKRLPQFLNPEGRAAIIRFHSLEDRILKTSINDDLFEAITRKPIRATDAEINTNPRSHSAKLRIVKPVER